jgi:Kelch motif
MAVPPPMAPSRGLTSRSATLAFVAACVATAVLFATVVPALGSFSLTGGPTTNPTAPLPRPPPSPSPPTPSPLPPTVSSTNLTPLAYTVNAAGVAAVGDRIVIAGGVRDLGYGPINLGTILVYNASNGKSFVSAKSFPTPRRGVMAFADGTDVYLLGGYDGSYLTDIWVYSPLNDSLRFAGNLPQPRCYGGLAFDGTRAYVVGGISAYLQYASAILAFDPATGVSSVLNVSLPSGIWGDSAASFHGLVYVFGGYNLTASSSAILAFDPARAGVAHVVAYLPNRLSESSVVVDGNVILLSGGKETYAETPAIITRSVFVYSPLLGGTTVLQNALPVPRFSEGSLIIAGGGLLIVGGRDVTGAAVDTVFLVTLNSVA